MKRTRHRYHLDQATRFQALPVQLLVHPVLKTSIKQIELFGETLVQVQLIISLLLRHVRSVDQAKILRQILIRQEWDNMTS